MIEQRLEELRPGAQRAFAGWKGQYNCAKRLHRLTLEAHPGFRENDARLTAPLQATGIPGTDGSIDRGRPTARPPAKQTSRPLIAAAVLVLILLLVAPAALVLVLRDDGGGATRCGSPGCRPTSPCSATRCGYQRPRRPGHRARGRARRSRRATRDGRLPAAGRGRRRLGVDRERGRRQRHAPEPARPR